MNETNPATTGGWIGSLFHEPTPNPAQNREISRSGSAGQAKTASAAGGHV